MDASLEWVSPKRLPHRGGGDATRANLDDQMRKRSNSTQDLNAQIGKALRVGRVARALELCELIEKRKPDEPHWSLRKGDLLLRMGRDADATLAYQRAASLYAARGFDSRAAATAKLMPPVKVNDRKRTSQIHGQTA